MECFIDELVTNEVKAAVFKVKDEMSKNGKARTLKAVLDSMSKDSVKRDILEKYKDASLKDLFVQSARIFFNEKPKEYWETIEKSLLSHEGD